MSLARRHNDIHSVVFANKNVDVQQNRYAADCLSLLTYSLTMLDQFLTTNVEQSKQIYKNKHE